MAENSNDEILVKTMSGRHVLTVCRQDKVEEVKQRIKEKTSVLPEEQKLSVDGMLLEDNNTLAHYNIKSHLCVELPGEKILERDESPGKNESQISEQNPEQQPQILPNEKTN